MKEVLEIDKNSQDITFHSLDSDGEVQIEIQNHYMVYQYASIYLSQEEVKSVIEFLQNQLNG